MIPRACQVFPSSSSNRPQFLAVEKTTKFWAKPPETGQGVPMSQMRARLASALFLSIVVAAGSYVTAQAGFGSSYSSTKGENCWGTKGEKQVDDNTTRVCRGKVRSEERRVGKEGRSRRA